MNYKKKLLKAIKHAKANGIIYCAENNYSSKPMEKAFDLAHSILKTRFENELKQYNNDEERAYDEFIAKKNLDYLRVYTEEFLFLDKKEKKMAFYKEVQYHLRQLINVLHKEVGK